jgi:two-component system sensor histidine kinase DevS
MRASRPLQTPGALLLQIALTGLAVCGLAVWLAVQQPWLGLRLEADGGLGLRVVSVAPGSPALRVLLPGYPTSPDPETEVVLASALAGGSLRLVEVDGRPLLPDDLIEEPDFFSSYADIEAFLNRQSAIAAALAEGRSRGQLALSFATLDGEPGSGPVAAPSMAQPGSMTVAGESTPPGAVTTALIRMTVMPGDHRPLADLPGVFWFQLACGLLGMMTAAWVWVLRRTDWGARMFALTGIGFALATTSAAIYSTRELAIDGTLIRLLSAINHSGTFLFGVALIGMFLSFPNRLVSPRWILVVGAVSLAWLATDLLRIAPNQDLGVRLPIVLMLLAAIVAAGMQWRRSVGDPRARSALRWLGLSMIAGSGLFVMTIVMTRLLGWLPPLEQGYSFGFFLLIYAGLALGLNRARLFELDRWAFRVLLWVGGMLALLILDALLVLSLRLAPALSLGLSLLVVGMLYLPARNYLWDKLVSRGQPPAEALFPALMEVAFKASSTERIEAWQTLLQTMFDPLEILPSRQGDFVEPTLAQDGIELCLPAVASSPPLVLRHRDRGRRLFGSEQRRLATQLVELMRHADAGRDAFERGVHMERQRVARDLHDDLGAHLLSGLSHASLDETRQSIRDAIAEMRTVVTDLKGESVDLGAFVADLRHESAARLESAGIELDWPLTTGIDGVQVDYRICKNLGSMHREIVTNAIRHSRATCLQVTMQRRDDSLVSKIRDNGIGGALLASECRTPDRSGNGVAGHGLANLQRRIADLRGRISLSEGSPGTIIEIVLPLGMHESATQSGQAPWYGATERNQNG